MRHRNIILALAAVCTLSLAACGDNADKPHTLSNDELIRANTGAESYATRSGDTLLGCNGTDSPPIDNHTTCTLKPKNGTPYGIQCSYKSTGCKPK